jgi:hypothetical protein
VSDETDEHHLTGHRSGTTRRAGELPEDASLEDVLAAMTAPASADSHEAVMRRHTETLLLGAMGAALAGDHPAVWRHVRDVVDHDPVASAPVAIAANRLCAQLLDGVPVAALAPDARLQPALDFAALAAAPDFDGPGPDGGSDLTRLGGWALPVVADLLTAAALDQAAVQPITDRLRREPDLARDVLYLMVVASAQRLAVALRHGEQALRAHADHDPEHDADRTGHDGD